MDHLNKAVKVNSTENKVIEYRNQSNVITKLLVKALDKDVNLDMENIMTYCLTPIPYSIGTADGFLSKTDKAKSFINLTKDIDNAPIPQGNGMTIEDGNALFHIIKQIPGTFEKICEKFYEMLGPRGDVIVSTDMYSPCSKGKGKIKPMKLLLKSPSFCQVLAQLGEQWDVTDELISGMEKCVCAVYGGKKNKITKVGELRHFVIKSKCEESISASTIKNIDLSTLPPSKACLEQHIRRANYQTRIWKLANVGIYELPKPWQGHEWRENDEPLWCDEDQDLDENIEELENEENTDEDIDLILTEIDNDMVDIEEDEDDE